MPFKSEKQRRFLWAEHPDIAKRWAHEYPNQKKLPMYAQTKKTPDEHDAGDTSARETAKAASVTISELVNRYVNNRPISFVNNTSAIISKTDKTADSKQERVDIPHSSEPVYAGEERDKGEINSEIPGAMNISGTDDAAKEKPQNAINELLTKLSVVLSPHIEQTMENMKAEREGRVAVRIPRNRGIKRYPCATPSIPLPMGMAQSQAQPQAPQQQNNQYPTRPVGGGSNPQFNPINAFGAISMSGVINGNAAFGAKNSPDSSKLSCWLKQACRSEVLGKIMSIDATEEDVAYWEEEYADELAGRKAASILDINTGDSMGDMTRDELIKLARCWAGYEPVPGKKPYSNDSCRPIGSGKKKKKENKKSEKKAGTPAWQRSEGKNDEGGLNAKGRASYNKATGGHLKAPVTESNPKGTRAKRQNSFCARMCGMKRVNTGGDTAKDPDSRINKSLRKWNCKCSSAMEFGQMLSQSQACHFGAQNS